MTTDAGAEPSGQAEPKYITEADLRAFQSAADKAHARELAQERELTNEFASRVTELEARLEAAESRGYEDDDPRMVELRKQLTAAEKKARDATSLMSRFSPSYKNAVVENEALKLAFKGDPQVLAAAEEYGKALMAGRTESEVRQLAKQLRTAVAAAPTPPPPPGRDEIDLGRGSGRSGSPRITQALLREHAGDLAWYRANKEAINAAAAQPGGLPER